MADVPAPRRPRLTGPAVGLEKAAILLLTLGPEAAAGVFRHLSDQEVRQLSGAIARLRTIPRDQAAAVHEEAWRWLSNREGFLVDGEHFVRQLVESKQVAGTAQEQEVKRELARAAQDESEVLAQGLEDVAPQAIAQMLATEHPQVIAFVLAHLPPRQAADVLAALPAPLPADVVHRIAGLKNVPGELLADVGSVLHGQLAGLGTAAQGGASAGGGARLAAEIMNLVDRTVEEQVFTHLQEAAPELSEQIRNLMLTFEDLARLDNRGMQTLLKEIPREDLLLALKTASPTMRDKIFGNMSQRAAEILQDDLGSMGPVRLREVEKAQSNIVAVARRLEEEQKISLGGGTGEDALV
jgi:flagellar motor switch protein FliG